jgi:hypothetical protein
MVTPYLRRQPAFYQMGTKSRTNSRLIIKSNSNLPIEGGIKLSAAKQQQQIKERPKRIQRKRVKGWTLAGATTNPNGAVSVTRPGRYGNPFKVGDVNDAGQLVTAKKCLEYFEFYLLRKHGANLANFLLPLRGKDLACFCPLESECHADILIRLANQEPNQ